MLVKQDVQRWRQWCISCVNQFCHHCLVKCRARSILSTPWGMFTQQREGRIIFGLWLFSSFFKAVELCTKPSPLYPFYRLPCELGTYSYQYLGSDHWGLESKCCVALFAFPFTPLFCPWRGFCCCISAFLLCVQEVSEQTSECFDSCSPSPETNMRTEHRQRQRLMKQRRCC